jgi:hypothetical protein
MLLGDVVLVQGGPMGCPAGRALTPAGAALAAHLRS